MEPDEELEIWFMRWGVWYQEIIRAAIVILEDNLANGKDLCCDGVQAQRKADAARIDFACDLTKFLPEDKKQLALIVDYAWRKRDDCYAVRKFVYSVPNSVWYLGAPIAGSL